MDDYDVIVLGAGPAGENVADRVVRGGLSAVLVESELLGGECSYWACMPSKALLRDAEALAEVRRLPGAAAAVTGRLDSAKVLARRDEFVHHYDDSSQLQWADDHHIDVVRGHGRISGERTVEVKPGSPDGAQVRQLRARAAVVVATGSDASVPPVPGLREAAPWTSREGTGAKQVPARLAVVGGGVVACELATAYAALGSSVTVVERGQQLLGKLEPFAGDLVAQSLQQAGVDLRLGATLSRVTTEEGSRTLHLDDGDRVDTDQILVAAGRRPRTGDIGLDTVGLQPGSSIEVDDTCRATGVPSGWLYAIGDANGRRLLTHMGKYQGRICGDAIVARSHGESIDAGDWSPYAATANRVATPAVIFTDPQVGTVGRTEAQARKDGIDVRAVDYDIGQVAGASLYADGYVGHARLVVDESRRVLVGATFVGGEAGELLHAATVAVVGEVPLQRLWHAVPSYPTISEVWLRLLETYGL